MKTAHEKVAWALRFMVTNLDSLREGDRLNLRDDIVLFVGWSQEDFPIWEPSEIEDFLTRENIGATQKETQEILEAIGRVNTLISPHKSASLGGRWEQPTQTVQAWGLVYSQAEPPRFYIRANLQESFRFALLTALLQIDYRRLLLCPPPCGRPFFRRHARQQFCSTPCKNRSALKSFRERKRQEKAKKKAHQQSKQKSAGKSQARVSAGR